MTDLTDQDDAATAVPVVQKWLRWLATPKVASSLGRRNEPSAQEEYHAPLTQALYMYTA